MNTNYSTGIAVVVTLLLAACGGGGGGDAGGAATAPAIPDLSIADSSVAEGHSGATTMSFVVSLTEALSSDVQMNYTTNGVTADATDVDIVQDSFTIPAGLTQATIDVVVHGDTEFETDETLTVNLENIPSTVNAVRTAAFGTIRTDDFPTLSIAPAEIEEGDASSRTLVFQVQLAGITNDIAVDFATSDNTATVADNDYVPVSGTLVIPARSTSATIEVEIVGDTAPELHEMFLLTLSNLDGDAVLNPGASSAMGTIRDDDTPIVLEPTVSAPPGFGSEGDTGTTELLFTLSVSTPVASEIVIDYATSDLSAVAGVDYNAASGRLRIPAGATAASIPVQIIGDDDVEGPEYVNLNLTLVSTNVILATPRVVGLISDDDYVGPPILSALRTSVFEGDTGTRTMEFTVALSDAAADVVTVDYATRDVTALAGSDYESAGGTLSFAPGETIKTVPVTVNGDTVIEAHEILELALSNLTGSASLGGNVAEGIIESDDPFAMVSIGDVAAFEGDAGTSNLVFTVSINAAAADPVTFNYASVDGTATAGADYGAVSGSINIPAGDTQATITVELNGDTDAEADETFTIELSSVSQNAELADATAVGTIVNDDRTPGWGVARPLNQDGQDNVLPQVAMNASGTAMAVWAPTIFGRFESNSYTPGGSWGALQEQSTDSVSGSVRTDRDLFIDGSGRSTLGWIFGIAGVAQHTDASGWGAEHEFDPASYRDQEFMRLAGNESGSVMAIWKLNVQGSSGTDHLMYSVYDPIADQWSTNAFLVFEGQFISWPALAMDPNGNAIAVWLENGVRASRYDAATALWSTPLPISRELAADIYAPGYQIHIAMDPAGNAMVVWDDGLSLGTSVRGSVWASRYDAAADDWDDDPFQVELSTLDATHAQVAMDAAGNAFVVWLQDNDDTDGFNDSFEIWARRYVAATDSWEAEALVQNPDTRLSQFGLNVGLPLDVPALAVDPDGNAILAWSEDINGEFIIRASRYDIANPADGWGAPTNISGTAYPFAIFPDIAMDANGNAIVVWQAGNSEQFGNTDISEVWANDYVR